MRQEINNVAAYTYIKDVRHRPQTVNVEKLMEFLLRSWMKAQRIHHTIHVIYFKSTLLRVLNKLELPSNHRIVREGLINQYSCEIHRHEMAHI